MNTKLVVIQGDISQLKVDTIVPAADLDECLRVQNDRGQVQAEERLGRAYLDSLKSAAETKARTIAFPNVSDPLAGFSKGFSKNKAAFVALTAVRNFVTEQPGQFTEIIFVCWDTENYHLYKEMLGSENRVV
jgi:O-acetyl-ADP-ribose deacetylase (regulator of RNase III)